MLFCLNSEDSHFREITNPQFQTLLFKCYRLSWLKMNTSPSVKEIVVKFFIIFSKRQMKRQGNMGWLHAQGSGTGTQEPSLCCRLPLLATSALNKPTKQPAAWWGQLRGSLVHLLQLSYLILPVALGKGDMVLPYPTFPSASRSSVKQWSLCLSRGPSYYLAQLKAIFFNILER